MQQTKSNITIRRAVENDIPSILQMINELAEFEKLSNEVKAAEENLREYIFGKDKFLIVWIAEINKTTAGHLISFRNFSTFLTRPGLYIEELYVKPEFRSKGVGKQLMLTGLEFAQKNNFGRVEWAVLDWNDRAINFYKSLNAEELSDWKIFRIPADRFGKITSG